MAVMLRSFSAQRRDIAKAEFLEKFFRRIVERPVTFDRIDAAAKPGEDAGLITRARTDLQHLIAVCQLQRLGHLGDDGWLRNRLPFGDGQGDVLPCLKLRSLKDESFARNGFDRREHALVRNAGDIAKMIDQFFSTTGKRQGKLPLSSPLSSGKRI